MTGGKRALTLELEADIFLEKLGIQELCYLIPRKLLILLLQLFVEATFVALLCDLLVMRATDKFLFDDVVEYVVPLLILSCEAVKVFPDCTIVDSLDLIYPRFHSLKEDKVL